MANIDKLLTKTEFEFKTLNKLNLISYLNHSLITVNFQNFKKDLVNLTKFIKKKIVGFLLRAKYSVWAIKQATKLV